jgi:hypothetical protein
VRRDCSIALPLSVVVVFKMDSLPAEIVANILTYVPKRSLTSCRLVCRSMAVLAFPALFGHLIRWLDYETSHRAVISLAVMLIIGWLRRGVLWATGPDGPVDPVFLSVVWKLLQKCEPPGLLCPSRTVAGEAEDDQVKEGGKLDVDHKSNTSGFAEEKREAVKLSAKNFAELSGRE